MNTNKDFSTIDYFKGVADGFALASELIRKKQAAQQKRMRLSTHMKYFILWWKTDFEITISNTYKGIADFFSRIITAYKESQERYRKEVEKIRKNNDNIERMKLRSEKAKKNVELNRNKYLIMSPDEFDKVVYRFILDSVHQYIVLQHPIITPQGEFILNDALYIELRTYVYGMFESTFGQLKEEFDILYFKDYLFHEFNKKYDIARTEQIPQLIKNILKGIKIIEEGK